MIEFGEDGLPILTGQPEVKPEVKPEVQAPLAFQPRLYRALVELADLVAENGAFTQEELVKIINRWSTDPPLQEHIDEDISEIEVGLDQLKLFHAIEEQSSGEAEIEEQVLGAIKAYEDQPDFENMDQIDYIIYEQEKELEKNGQGVAYLTACLNQDPGSAHEIIDEMGCSLTHLLTQWFVMYMISKEEPEAGETAVAAIRRRVGLMGMENAKAAAMTPSQRREKLEEQVERWRHMTGYYDQEDGEGDAS